MANFEISFGITEKMEGGYTTNPNETYSGIDRKYQPNWEGWAWLDKKAKPITTNTKFSALNKSVKAFFRSNFWKPLNCMYMTQELANQLFDFAVHSGKSKAAKTLQVLLNSKGAFLKVDGIIGSKSLSAIKRFDSSQLSKDLLAERERFINVLAAKNPQFKRGWLNRIVYLKSFLTPKNVFGLTVGVVAAASAIFFLTKSS